MKLTTRQLRHIIVEELKNIFKEQNETETKDIDGDNFGDGNDFDHFPDGKANKGCLFFDQKQMYEKEQKTHGLLSHALKHSHEPGLERAGKELNNLISNFIKTLSSEKYKEVKIYYGIYGDNKKPVSRDTFKPNKFVIINTIDRINDARLSNQKLLPIEQDIIKLTKNLSAVYLAIAKEVIKNPDAQRQSVHDKLKRAFVKGKVVVLTYGNNITSVMGSCKKGPPKACLDRYLKAKKSDAELAAIAAKKRQDSMTKGKEQVNKQVDKIKRDRIKAAKKKELNVFVNKLKGQGMKDDEIVSALTDKFKIDARYAKNLVNPKR